MTTTSGLISAMTDSGGAQGSSCRKRPRRCGQDWRSARSSPKCPMCHACCDYLWRVMRQSGLALDVLGHGRLGLPDRGIRVRSMPLPELGPAPDGATARAGSLTPATTVVNFSSGVADGAPRNRGPVALQIGMLRVLRSVLDCTIGLLMRHHLEAAGRHLLTR